MKIIEILQSAEKLTRQGKPKDYIISFAEIRFIANGYPLNQSEDMAREICKIARNRAKQKD